MPFSIGILLDSLFVPAWQKTIVEHILHQSTFKINLVVLNQSQLRSGSGGRWLYRLLRKSDRIFFRTRHDQFKVFDISELLKDVELRQVSPRQTKHKDEFLAEDMVWIRQHQPDILIRFGFRILKGEILQVAKYGMWSLHHGDSAVNRGGPPAFWEVVNKESVTGVTLQQLSEQLDAGKVLGKSFCKTDFTSFNRNQQSVYAAGIELFCGRLNDLQRLGPKIFFESLETNTSEYSPTLYRDPKGLQAFGIAINFWSRRVMEWLVKLFVEEQWMIYYKKENQLTFSFKDADPLVPPSNSDWADPFLFQHKNKDYLFFENLDKKAGTGKIDCMILGEQQEKPFRVLSEEYHLSYPSLIKEKEEIYLLAESAKSKSVTIYQSTDFPKGWRKVKQLLTDVECYDPSLYFHDGHWYLFVTQRPVQGASADQYLYLYFTNDLINAPLTSHPMNPLTRDVRGSRPAGKIFPFEGKLIRPTQIGTPKYGHGIRFQEVIKLTPTEYLEKPHKDIFPWSKNILATHTFSFSDGFIATDAQRRRFKYF